MSVRTNPTMATIAVTELVSTVSLMMRVTMSLLASAPELLCKSYIAILSVGVGGEVEEGTNQDDHRSCDEGICQCAPAEP